MQHLTELSQAHGLEERLAVYAAAFPDRAAVIEGDNTTTYARLYELYKCVRHEMWQQGVREGTRILISCREAVPFFAAMLASMEIGALVLPVAYDQKALERSKILSLFDPEYIFSDRHDGSETAHGIHPLNVPVEFTCDRDNPNEIFKKRRLPPETELIIHVTSGSSGVPKAVGRQLGNLLDEAEAIASHTSMSPEDRILCASPLHHSFACGFWRAAIKSGACLVVSKGFSPKRFIELCSKHRITLTIGVPYHYMGLLQSEDLACSLSSLRLAYTGGVKLSKLTAQQFREHAGTPLLQEYGLSEGGVVSLNDSPHKPDSVGKPLQGVAVSILNEEGILLSANQIGEIHIQRPYAPLSYWSDSIDCTHSLNTKFGVPTGDLGWLDEDGYLYLSQRKKWMINVGGNKVDPAEVEEVMMGSGWVEECLVVPKKDEWRGEVVQAFIVAKALSNMDENDLYLYCRERLSAFKVPKTIHRVDKLQRSDSGKILRSYYMNEC
ncbi:class I adenylate-forming enzyme family protein [Paenibacillus sp. FJAT-26967]|uniref:class I adenylate-forming enzyme family protein n=1 Tax=Paenibacillus sp. FJAT-26967 TaxID=1729690 RepID=UPI0008382DA8|nr:AMP-binding protein [Paenibacillus sp. FJAT-26967]